MVGQEPHLAQHCAIPHDIYREHILLLPLAIDQSLLELHPTAGMVRKVGSPILDGGSYDVNHRIDQASDNACTISSQLGSPPGGHGRTLCHSRWPIGGNRHLPGDGRIGRGSCLLGNGRRSCCQCSNTSLLATIHSCRPCRRSHCSASHDGIADGAKMHGVLVGVGACATLP
jgi:hypothetical protein